MHRLPDMGDINGLHSRVPTGRNTPLLAANLCTLKDRVVASSETVVPLVYSCAEHVIIHIGQAFLLDVRCSPQCVESPDARVVNEVHLLQCTPAVIIQPCVSIMLSKQIGLHTLSCKSLTFTEPSDIKEIDTSG